MHQTGHNNSGVILGIYYKPGSLKARLNDQLIHFCNENEIKYELYGKIIVATEKEEVPIISGIYREVI
jgi:L-2-hydroxyglutarate oxidase